MVESSKILTVSYGTFSCTLEGFEDSFGTMKAIAEYFRDLAQGDRYFGAEPPIPDAEMLQKIAEKEIASRVEAREGEKGVVLRALNAPQAAPAMPPVAAPPAAAAAADAGTETPQAATQDTAAAAQAPDAPKTDSADDAATVAAALSDEETPQETLAVSTPDTAVEDMIEDDDTTVSFEDMAPAAMSAVPAHPDADSVAAKLQRIRAVVGAGATSKVIQSQTADEFSFTESASDGDDMIATDTAADDSTQTQTDDAEAQSETVAEDADTMTVADEDVIADADAAEAEADEGETAVADAVADDAETAEAEADAVADEAETAEAEAEAVADEAETAEAEAEAVADEVETAEAEAEAVADEAETAEAEAEADEAADTAEDEKPKQNFRARILRVAKKVTPVAAAADVSADTDTSIADQIRATLAAQTGEDTINEDAASAASVFNDIDAQEAADLASGDDDSISALSDADEAELLAELAAVEAEMEEGTPEAADIAEDLAEAAVEDVADPVAADTAEDSTADAITEDVAASAEDPAPAEKAEPVSSRGILPDNNDAAMSRIMDEADEQLSEPAGSRRRSAIAQLKAAVAATEAARQLGDKGSDAAAKESAFRDDLSNAVRPGADDALPRTEVRSERPRPAPLKLVASQRVDESDAAAAAESADVTPRRVSTKPAADAANFADFAAEMGATELPDLLEAAAAYTAFVEGIEDFSRPQIMKKVQASAAQEFSREDGLRSFGTLLRQGRISKVRNGRFQVSDQTRFKPEQKAG